MEDKKSVSRGKGGVAERADNPNLISIYCNRREDNQHFVVGFIKQGPCSVYFNRDRNDFLNALLFKMLLKRVKTFRSLLLSNIHAYHGNAINNAAFCRHVGGFYLHFVLAERLQRAS